MRPQHLYKRVFPIASWTDRPMDRPMDRRTNGPMYQWTDKPSYRNARMHLKRENPMSCIQLYRADEDVDSMTPFWFSLFFSIEESRDASFEGLSRARKEKENAMSSVNRWSRKDTQFISLKNPAMRHRNSCADEFSMKFGTTSLYPILNY